MDDETDDVDDEEYDRINKEMYDDVNVELKDAEFADAGKGDEEITDAEKVNVELEEVNQEVAGDQVKDDAQATVTAAPCSETEIISNEFECLKVNHENPSNLYFFPALLYPSQNLIRKEPCSKKPSHLTEIPSTGLYIMLSWSQYFEDGRAMDKVVVEKVKENESPDNADREEAFLLNLGEDMGKTDEPPSVKADPKDCDLAKAEKPSKTFNDLMTTPIDFTAFAINHLQISDLTKANLEEAPIETYTTSLTKTKDAKYDLKGIKDMVPTLWSPIKVVYDKHALLGTSHWRSKRQTFYGYASNRVSKHDVYSTKRILALTNVKFNKWYGYGHLEEIEVRRAYQQLYNFMEGDFLRLHLNDIKDMFLLIVQNKLINLKSDIIVDLAAALLRDTFHDMATNLRMGYDKAMPRRRWSNLDKKRSHIMVKDIDRQLLERRLMRSLEKNLVEGNTGKTSDCFSGQYDFVIPCSTLSGQIL
ncbi:hypothetical protein Tco_1409089 [Tanacetum coccineum]